MSCVLKVKERGEKNHTDNSRINNETKSSNEREKNISRIRMTIPFLYTDSSFFSFFSYFRQCHFISLQILFGFCFVLIVQHEENQRRPTMDWCELDLLLFRMCSVFMSGSRVCFFSSFAFVYHFISSSVFTCKLTAGRRTTHKC